MNYYEEGKRLFDGLFVLELANNHWGSLERGQRIVNDFAQVVRFNNVRAAIKLQFREVDHFIHKDFRGRDDIRYIKKTEATRLTKAEYRTLVKAIKDRNCIPMATAFDEASVDLCEELDLPIIKIASSDINDWFLIERIAEALEDATQYYNPYGGIGIRQTPRQTRRHGARIDAAAAEYVRLTTQRSNLVAKLARAETRDKATT